MRGKWVEKRLEEFAGAGDMSHVRETVNCSPIFVFPLLQLAIDMLAGHIAAQIKDYISQAPLKLGVAAPLGPGE